MTDGRFSETIGGGKDLKVRLVTKPGSPYLYVEMDVKQGGTWRTKRESLKHADLALGRAYAHRLLGAVLVKRPEFAEPAKRGRPTQAESAPERVGGVLTLGRVVALYQRSATFLACVESVQRDRTTACRILLDFVDPESKTAWRDLPANALDPDKVQALVTAWGTGAYKHPTMKRTGAKPGRIKNALAYLRSACNWAHTVRTGTGRLLPEKVFEGITLPVELNPLQPRMEEAVLDQLFAISERFPTTGRHSGSPPGPSRFQFRLLLILAEAWGNRINALLHLRPEDIRFEESRVWWNPAHDKMGKGRTSYLPEDVARAARAELDRPGRPESPWLFFAPTAPEKPLSYATAVNWLNAAYTLLGLERPAGLGYHSLRRKWRSDRDDQPLKAVMEEGGWSSVESVMRYAKPNDAERRAVANAGGRKIRSAISPESPTQVPTHEMAPDA